MPSMVPVPCASSSMMRTRASAGQLQPGHDLVGLGLQSVAGQDGRGFAEGFVAGGAAAAQVVVVERRQIVMHQRVGVQHLDGRAQFVDAVRQSAAHHPRRLHAQDGTQSLASGKDTVAHRLVDGGGILRRCRQQTFQRGIGNFLALE